MFKNSITISILLACGIWLISPTVSGVQTVVSDSGSFDDYGRAVLASKPIAYWRTDLGESIELQDLTGRGHLLAIADPSTAMPPRSSRDALQAGERMMSSLTGVGDEYSVEVVFRHARRVDADQVTGYLLSRGLDGPSAEGLGDSLGITGTLSASPGRLMFFNGNRLKTTLEGRTLVEPNKDHHVVFTRKGPRVIIYLNGNPVPEIDADAPKGYPDGTAAFYFGGRCDSFKPLGGRTTQIAVYDRALGGEEVARHFSSPRKVVPATAVPGSHASIQEAIDANPGKMVFVPTGDYAIHTRIEIRSDNAGLYGPGRIIQTNPNEPIIVVERAQGVRLSDLTLTRPEGKMDTDHEGIKLIQCTDTVVEGIRMHDNRSRSGSIYLIQCVNCQVINCQLINYTSIAIDDRTNNPLYGYAFNCIDGTGISVRESQGTLIQGNSIIERNLRATREVQEKYQLGKWVKRAPQRGKFISEADWNKGYSGNWHQGSAIAITSPWTTDYTRVIGNHIENPAQGCDIHTDHVIFSNNIIQNASAIAMKACHGARNVIITGNHIAKANLIAIAISPAAASSPALPATNGQPAQPANCDGGHIIANNTISDFGFGDAAWMWEGSTVLPVGNTPISIGVGQMPDDPPLRDVLVTGNLIYDTGRDQILQNGIPTTVPPRYKYAVFFVNADETTDRGVLRAPQNVRFLNNLFNPGTIGVSNVPLPQ